MQDFRGQGAPADIGTFQFPASAFVFQHTFEGVTYTCAIRSGERGWVPIDHGTDSANVICAASAYLNGVGGGKLFVARGTYLITWSAARTIAPIFYGVLLYDNVPLEGEGESTLFNADANLNNHGSNFYIITNFNHVAGNTGWQIRNIKVDGNRATQAGPDRCNALRTEGVQTRFTIDTFIVVDDLHGIWIHQAVDSEIINTTVSDCTNGGIWVGHETSTFRSKNVYVIACRVKNGRYAFAFQSIDDSAWIACHVYNSGYGFSIESNTNSKRNGAVECTVDTTTDTYGFYSGGGTNTHNVFSTCKVISAHTTGFLLRGSYNFCIGCTAIHCTSYNFEIAATSDHCGVKDSTAEGGTSAGIFVEDDFAIVEGNHIHDNGGAGIQVYICDNVIVEGNDIHGNNDVGIYLDRANLCNVANNKSYLNTSHGIRLDGGTTGTCDNNVVEGNHCHSSVGASTHGIWLYRNCDNNLIVGNKCYNNNGNGIRIQDATNIGNRVVGNDLRGNVSAYQINDAGTDTILPEIFIEVTDPDGNIGTHPAVVLTDGVDVTVRFQIPIPMDCQFLVRAQVIIVAGGTGNMRRSVSTNFGKLCASEVYNTHTDSIAAGEVAVTINILTCIDIAAALDGLVAGDLVGAEFTRHGSHVNDTVNADCYFLGFRLQYV